MENILDTIWLFICSIFRFFMPWTVKQDVKNNQKPVCDQRSRPTESTPQSGNENLSADNNQLEEVETKTLKNPQPEQERESEFEDRDKLFGSEQELTKNCPVYEDPQSKEEIVSGDSLANSMNSDDSAEETISGEMDADLMKNSELKETNFVENDVDLLKNCQPEETNSGNKNANLMEKPQPEYEPASEKGFQLGKEIDKTSKKNGHSDQENADFLQNFPSEEQPFLEKNSQAGEQPFLEKNSQAGEMTTVSFENTQSKENPFLEDKHVFGEVADSKEELQQEKEVYPEKNHQFKEKEQISAKTSQSLEELELDSKENKANPRRTIQSNDKSISKCDVNDGNKQAGFEFDSSHLKSGNLDIYHIQKDLCGLIIGRKGKTKKEFMKQSQASVEIEELKSEPFNILKITGSHDQRKHAGQLISNCLKLSDLSEFAQPSMKRRPKDKSLSTLDKETEEDMGIDEAGPLNGDSQNSQTKKKTKKKKKSKNEESMVSADHQRQRQTNDKVADKPKEIGSGEYAARFIEEEYAELSKKQDMLQKQSISKCDVNNGNNQADFDSSQLKSGNLDIYHIPKDFCGLIIGRKGKTIKEIMKQSQASVEIEELKSEPFNILKITGSHDQRKHAGQVISNCLKLPDLSEYHPPSMKRGAKDKSLSTLDKNNESEPIPSKKSKKEPSQTSSKVQSAKVRKVSADHQRQRQTSDKVANKPKEIGYRDWATRFIEEEYAELDKKQETLQKQKPVSGTHNKSKAAKGPKAKATEEKRKEETKIKAVADKKDRDSCDRSSSRDSKGERKEYPEQTD